MNKIDLTIKTQIQEFTNYSPERIFKECLHSSLREFPDKDLTDIVTIILSQLQAKNMITPRLEEIYKQTMREVERRNQYRNDIIFWL